jgi:phosphoribosyl-AMP cyclohydrolase
MVSGRRMTLRRDRGQGLQNSGKPLISTPHGKFRILLMTASSPAPPFAPRLSIEQVEEGHALAPRFDEHGLIPVVTTDAETGELLMHGYMNAEALAKTIETAEAHYYSRSRKSLWHKGATSGLVQKVVEMRIDDDQDAVWLKVRVAGSGASCHVGFRSCFYRAVPVGGSVAAAVDKLVFTEQEKTFDPKEVYGDAPNPTQL